MTNLNVESKSARVLAALESGEELTGKQIASRFSVGNHRALVSALRMNGYAIYANQRTDTKGRVKTKYRIGTAARSVVAAGYRAIASVA